ncbi:RNA polymerase sigma-70 factor (ECF subfamily) [Paenibacillus taihuensis]|uniref:RNA polymerase sigma-70 factor (ECF subfamily) n=1 Tax=Paenibacillus taihuensis TaxID=1156355 RepID=A0A3D9RP75_9BACL|nr:RNA polymerase sigma factor [Paenibacillus taihuensis]REE78563.1 RNA polymerase sigma-70 factor (ECF subfamily) [Paenibacillus taihuensis]
METNSSNTWLESMIDRYHNSIFKYCYHMLRQRQDAEDACQDIFVKTMRSLNNQKNIQSEANWIYRIAHNHCLNILKKRRLLRLLPFIQEWNVDFFQNASLAHVESSLDIDRLLSGLSSEERSIMVLRIIEDKSFEEIGAIINYSSATTRKKFERSRRKLQKLLKSEQGEHEHEKTSISYL